MTVDIRAFENADIQESLDIWNEVVKDGKTFPQMDVFDEVSGTEFFTKQTYTGLAYKSDNKEIVGIYILHPNNIGRCGHICNASYAVKKELRGQHIGEKLVKHCMSMGRQFGFKILQFNAVVVSNTAALHLYEKLGFVKLGLIPNGFLRADGVYEDILPHYIEL